MAEQRKKNEDALLLALACGVISLADIPVGAYASAEFYAGATGRSTR